MWRSKMQRLLKPQEQVESSVEAEKVPPKSQELDPEQIVEEMKEAERMALKK